MAFASFVIAGILLSTLGRLFTNYLQSIHGFTCGIDDMILTGGIEKQRTELISGSYEKTVEAVTRFADIKHKKGIDESKLRTAVQTKLRNPDVRIIHPTIHDLEFR